MKELIAKFKKKGYLLSPEILKLQSEKIEEIYSKIEFNSSSLKILDSTILQKNDEKKLETNNIEIKTSVEILKKFNEENLKRNVTSFVEMYNDRFNKISSYLRKRSELANITSIKSAKTDNANSNISVIGMVTDINISKNNNYIIKIEDPTGNLRIMVTEKNAELYSKAADIILDEVIGITGSKSRGYIFANDIFFPDIPNTFEFKKSSDETYAVFISDIHVGAATFMEESFAKFIDWISGKTGSDEQKEIAKKIGYLFINGDVVDGIGIYPTQEQDLAINDIYDQFKVFSNFIKKIPERIQIILTPGNHDGVRIAEPQPPYPRKFFEEIYDKKNFYFVQNPSYVKIHAVNGDPGFIVLSYHGYSFDHYCLDVQSLRNAGGYGAVEKVVEFLLKKRHLAPTHGSTLFTPSPTDELVIDIVPDIVTTGHVRLRFCKIIRINCLDRIIFCLCSFLFYAYVFFSDFHVKLPVFFV